MTEKRISIKFDAPIEVTNMLNDFKERLGIKTDAQAYRTLIKLSPKIDSYEINSISFSKELKVISHAATKDEIKSLDDFKKRFSIKTRTEALEQLILISKDIGVKINKSGDSLAKERPKKAFKKEQKHNKLDDFVREES